MTSIRSSLLNISTKLLMSILCRMAPSPLWFCDVSQRLDAKTRIGLDPAISVEQCSTDVPGWYLRNSKADDGKVILYLHGGAFIMDMPQAYKSMLGRICTATGMSAFMPTYRLAPEHLFPAAPEDCLSAYRRLLTDGVAANDIVVMGDSAGGNLALVLLHLIRREQLPMPAAAVMFSPVLDMAQLSGSWRLHTRIDPMYCVQSLVNPVEHYLPKGSNLLNPLISPCYGDISDFPPLLCLVGSIEALLDDSVSLIKKAVEVGVAAEVHIWCGMPHVFTLRNEYPETTLAITELAKTLRRCLDGNYNSPLYRDCIRVFDRQAVFRRLSEFSNSKYLAASFGGDA